MTCYTCWAGLTAIISIGDFVGSCCNNGNNFDNICKKEKYYYKYMYNKHYSILRWSSCQYWLG